MDFANVFTVRAASFLCSLSHVQLAELVNFVSAAIFDVLVVAFTVFRTGHLALQSREAKINKSLSFILFRDGMSSISFIWFRE